MMRLSLRRNLRDQTTGESEIYAIRHTRYYSLGMQPLALPSRHCMLGISGESASVEARQTRCGNAGSDTHTLSHNSDLSGPTIVEDVGADIVDTQV